jgi:K+-sensing histidine kinase KdpD
MPDPRPHQKAVIANNPIQMLLFQSIVLERAIGNLLDNALRYIPPGGEIEVMKQPEIPKTGGTGLVDCPVRRRTPS